MSREARRVPTGWEHPQDSEGRYKPLYADFVKSLTQWEEDSVQWDRGFRRGWGAEEWVPLDDDHRRWGKNEWLGTRPEPDEYMPAWPESLCTKLMMYETCTEGTPISPAFDTPEELAHWLADNGGSAFGDMTASYEGWLATIQSDCGSIGLVIKDGVMQSGVEAMK